MSETTNGDHHLNGVAPQADGGSLPDFQHPVGIEEAS